MNEKFLSLAWWGGVGVILSAVSGIGFYEAVQREDLVLGGVAGIVGLLGTAYLSVASYKAGIEKDLFY